LLQVGSEVLVEVVKADSTIEEGIKRVPARGSRLTQVGLVLGRGITVDYPVGSSQVFDLKSGEEPRFGCGRRERGIGDEPIGADGLGDLASRGGGNDDEFFALVLDFPSGFDVVESGVVDERDDERGIGLARDVGDVGGSSERDGIVGIVEV
jgi:hypothetical protein